MKTILYLTCLLYSSTAFGQGQWQTSGSNSYTLGRVAVGTSTIGKMLEVSANEADHMTLLRNTHASGYGLYLVAQNDPLRIVPFSGGGESLFVVNGIGKVGIGVSDPAHHLQVSSASGTTPVIAVGKINGDTNGSSKLAFYAGSGGAANGFTVDYKKTAAIDRLAFIDGGNVEVMSMLNGGKIGIGTTNPGSFKLAVEGKIGAREVNVTTTSPWPDYVFTDQYKLPSIESLKQFIDEHKHLPDVPTAKEVEANGVNIGEMNALLLKKIEELTLYVIDLKSELDEVKSKVK